jgi:hypothetical protein
MLSKIKVNFFVAEAIRGALQATMAGFGCGVCQVVKLYESTASTDARTF